MKFKEFLNEGIHDKGIFKAIMMGGSSASGKSYVISKIKSGSIEPRLVNTDTWVEFYMKHDPNFNWKKYGDKTKQLTKTQLTNYLNSMLPLWIDGTSANSSAVLRRKGILQSIGYDTGFIFVNTDVETAIKRNEARGRVVDREFLEKSYEESQKLKSYYKTQFHFFKEINNNEGELTDKVILDAYRQTTGFFTSPIQNPIGRDLKTEMLAKGQKYLIETEHYDKSYLSKLVDSWYRN
jgi:hypothetical protein